MRVEVKYNRPRRRPRGFTLAEMIITLALFSLFSTTVVATLSATLNFWNQQNARILAQQNVRICMQLIVTEMRQSVRDGDPITGYASLGLTTPTTVLSPNVNQQSVSCTSSTLGGTATSTSPLVFTEANQTNYQPTSASFNASSSNNFQQVLFYVNNSTAMHRVVTTYTSTGAVATTTDMIVATASAPGLLALSAQYYNANAVTVTVTAVESEINYSLTTTVMSLAQ